MLPAALQMQPPQEPLSPTVDILSSTFPVRERDAQDQGAQLPRDFAFPHQRSFPIRIPHPHSQTPLREHDAARLALFAPLPEYRLRRKTPNGTVDSAYDGSPLQPLPGPPPLKHMILPASVQTRSSASTNVGPLLARQNWTNTFWPFGTRQDLAATSWLMNNGLQSTQYPMIKTQRNSHLQTQSRIPRSPGQKGASIQQPIMQANEYNLRAICPPPFPNGAFPLGQTAWQQGSPPWDHRSLDQSEVRSIGHRQLEVTPDDRPTLYNLVGHSAPGCWAGPSHPHRATGHSVYDEFWSLDYSMVPRPISVAQPGFKEKALAHAHQSYAHLLAFMQASGRANPLKANSGSGAAYRLPVSSRPRKPISGSLMSSSPTTAVVDPGYVSAHAVRDCRTSSAHLIPTCEVQLGMNQHEDASSDTALFGYGNRRHSFILGQQIPVTHHRPLSMTLPIDRARASVEVLESLCEQSAWTWLEGMLLGGCLNYGLERYEDALAWFSRIVTTNPG